MNLKTKFHLRSSLLAVTISILFQNAGYSQQPVENSIFWEVSGNGLSKPSYLFGTFHLLGKDYVDSLTAVTRQFQQSEAVVGELLMDSSVTMKVMQASLLNGTTLNKVLSPELYAQTSAWLKELMGFDLSILNAMQPMLIQSLIMIGLQNKYHKQDLTKVTLMDAYFQQEGKKTKKKVIGLESVEVQIQALYGQFSYERQAELLADYVSNKDKAYKELVDMNQSYRKGSLVDLEKLMSSQTYDAKEAVVLLDNRNINWITILPSVFKEQSTFVAVGALHLSGKNGLISLLRRKGFTVKPLAMN